jgi:hypothetical protein
VCAANRTQQARKTPIGQHLAPSLATRAVVGFIVGVANALNRIAASRTRLAISAMHRHVLAESRHFFGKDRACFGLQLTNPVLKRFSSRREQAFLFFGI